MSEKYRITKADLKEKCENYVDKLECEKKQKDIRHFRGEKITLLFAELQKAVKELTKSSIETQILLSSHMENKKKDEEDTEKKIDELSKTIKDKVGIRFFKTIITIGTIILSGLSIMTYNMGQDVAGIKAILSLSEIIK